MIHLLVLAVAALHLQDPAGDAVGDGTLAPPTAPIYANTSDFDLQSVTLTSDPTLTVQVTMGALSDPGKLPNGFSNPIIEVYLDTGPGGAQQLLPGSGMSLAPKHGWNIAIRATGDEAYAIEARKEGAPASWPRLPVTVDVQGTTITLHTTIKRPARAEIYAITGVYDPFTQDAWRPLSTTVSPWAFSSSTQHVPVVDVLASGQGAQRREIDSGVLLPYRSPTHGLGWLVLMVLGLITAAGGLVVRRRVRAPERAPSAAAEVPAGAEHEGDRADEATRAATGGAYERFLDETEEATLWPDADRSVDRAVAAHALTEQGATGDAGSAEVDGPPVGEALSAERASTVDDPVVPDGAEAQRGGPPDAAVAEADEVIASELQATDGTQGEAPADEDAAATDADEATASELQATDGTQAEAPAEIADASEDGARKR